MRTRTQSITVGDLVVAATDAALEVSKNKKRAYQLAGVVVNKILRASTHETVRRLRSGDEGRRFH
ncbi:MAG: hypothetical protein ACREQK_08070 [Candidatus Binatia bacterium]